MFTSWQLLVIATLTILSPVVTEAANTPTFTASYGSSPQPFQIDVNPDFVALTKLKAFYTRYTIDINETAFVEGPPHHNITALRNHLVNNYSWPEVQKGLNDRFKQFTTTVSAIGPQSNFSDPVALHFVHHRSNRSDAIPLLFVHGWPGSFLEVSKIIDGLTNPAYSSIPAFHVVAPSHPGTAFSPAPTSPGLGLHEMGSAFNNLMIQLGYPQYVGQGGDWGGYILRMMGGDFPDNLVSQLSNNFYSSPNATDLQRYAEGKSTEQERICVDAYQNYALNLAGYREEQGTRPLQVAIAMTDSPVGFAAWVYDFMYLHVDDYWWNVEEIITWAMMYYIPGPYAGFRFYKTAFNSGKTNGEDGSYVTNPVAYSVFARDLYSPREWSARTGNIVQYIFHERGGHFAAYEKPDELLQDIAIFFGNRTLSNLGVFEQK